MLFERNRIQYFVIKNNRDARRLDPIEESIVETLALAESIAVSAYSQRGSNHQINVSCGCGFARTFLETEKSERAFALVTHPVQAAVFASHRKQHFDSALERPIDEQLGVGFVAVRQIAANLLNSVQLTHFGQIYLDANSVFWVVFATRAILPNQFAQPGFFGGTRVFVHATNLASMGFAFALRHDDVILRPLKTKDARQLERLILGNREWLRPWEATNPYGPNKFDIRQMVRGLIRQRDEHSGLPFIIEYRGQMAGQLNIANILYGSVSSAVLGYWIAPEFAGKNITPTAVALAVDYLFAELGLHRIEIDIRPENKASLRVVQKLGFRYEGLKKNFIHINGDWRDHYVFALTSPEVSSGLLNLWRQGRMPIQEYPFDI